MAKSTTSKGAQFATFQRQTRALSEKNFRIAFIRHWVFTTIRAFIAPVAFFVFIAYAKNLFIPPSTYGYGDAAPIQSLAGSIDMNRKLVLVNNGFGSQINDIIERVAAPVRQAGRQVIVLDKEIDLFTV